MLQALEVRAGQDPEQFARMVFQRMAAAVTLLMLRSHYFLNTRVSSDGRARRGRLADTAYSQRSAADGTGVVAGWQMDRLHVRL